MSCCGSFFLQAEDGIRDLVRSRGLGDVYKRQIVLGVDVISMSWGGGGASATEQAFFDEAYADNIVCLLYTSDAADERSSVDLGGRRIIKKKKIEIPDTVCLLPTKRYILESTIT